MLNSAAETLEIVGVGTLTLVMKSPDVGSFAVVIGMDREGRRRRRFRMRTKWGEIVFKAWATLRDAERGLHS